MNLNLVLSVCFGVFKVFVKMPLRELFLEKTFFVLKNTAV